MDKLRLGLEWFLNPDHVPLFVGKERGWFEDVGIDLELIEPAEHMDAIEEINAGNMDLAVTEPLHLVEDRAAGHPVVGFARFLHTNGGVMYLRDSGIERPRDMIGKRVQYPGAPGPGGIAIVKTMVEADGGVCTAKDFKPVNRGFYHTDALLEDEADVATLIFYNFEVIEARGRGANVGFFALKNWGVPDFCQLILMTTEETVERRRDVLERFLKVVRRGVDYVHQYGVQAWQVYSAHTETDPNDALARSIYNATVPCFTFDFSMSAEYYAQLSNWMLETGQIEQDVNPSQCWTNGLAF